MHILLAFLRTKFVLLERETKAQMTNFSHTAFQDYTSAANSIRNIERKYSKQRRSKFSILTVSNALLIIHSTLLNGKLFS